MCYGVLLLEDFYMRGTYSICCCVLLLEDFGICTQNYQLYTILTNLINCYRMNNVKK